MSPSSLIPVAEKIPVAWGYLHFLLLLTFVLHILFMNVMVGSAVIALAGVVRKKSHNGVKLSENLAGKIPFITAFTVNLGVAPLLFIQVLYGNFIYVSSILMGVFWLSVVVILVIAYYSLYIFKMKFHSLGYMRILFMGIAVAVLLIIGFIFTNNMTLMLHPEKWSGYFSRPDGTMLNLSDPTLVPRYLHFMTASIAVGGLFVSILGHFKMKRDPLTGSAMKKTGLKYFFHGTLVQMFIGIVFLVTLPREIMSEFMGGNLLYTGTLLTGIALGVISLMAAAKSRLGLTTATTVLAVISMAVVRDFLRASYLKEHFTVSSLEVAPQYLPMILFFIILVIGLISVYVMLKWAHEAVAEGAS